jgi:hypothetical protein
MIGHRPLLALDHSLFMTFSLPATGGVLRAVDPLDATESIPRWGDCAIPDASNALPRTETAEAVGQA